ncbi:MAG TPA: hypothetical protein VJ962_12355 [Clostridia bacterium]|nr:hypothetical protein [Clostridia bacterium]
MSTRAQIGIRGYNVYLYKNRDGYPSAVIPILQKTVRRYCEERGPRDYDFLLANILRSFERSMEEERKEMQEKSIVKDNFRNPDLMSFGIGTELLPGINYYYEVNLRDEVIEVYENNSFEIVDFSISEMDKIKDYEIGVNVK